MRFFCCVDAKYSKRVHGWKEKYTRRFSEAKRLLCSTEMINDQAVCLESHDDILSIRHCSFF